MCFLPFFLSMHGCVTAPRKAVYDPHPTASDSDAAFVGKDLILLAVRIDGNPHILSVDVCRLINSRLETEREVKDRCRIRFHESTLGISVKMDPRRRFNTKNQPICVKVFHRNRNDQTRLLAEWWVMDGTIHTKQPKRWPHTKTLIQSGGNYMLVRAAVPAQPDIK
jgi:hypothetical protein